MAMPRTLNLAGRGDADSDSDRALVAGVAAGDELALETLYQRHGTACFGYLLRRLDGDRPAAEDLLQDLLLAVWRGAAAYRGDSEVRPWLLGIAHRLWLQELRLRSRRPRLVEGEDADLDHRVPGGFHGEGATRLLLREALDTLPEDLRTAVDLTFGQGLRLQDAARLLDLPLGTVKSRLHRARQYLRRFLEATP